MIASAARVTMDKKDPSVARTRLPWQERAFAYYDMLGEIWYAAQFYARALSKLDLTLLKDAGTDDETLVDDPALTSYISRIQDPGGGRANLLAGYGRLKFLTGECYLLVTVPEPGDEDWEMLSCDELRVNKSGGYERFRAPNSTPEQLEAAPDESWEPLPDTAIAYRFWTRHPRYSNLADGPMRGVLDLCEELLILTRAVRARGRSRLAGSGILMIPSEVTFPGDPAGGDEDPASDPFLDRLTETMIAGISEEGSAAAVVPLVIRVGGEWIEKFRHLQILDPTETYPETGLRMECIQRIAMGLDMPPEILLGKADANHWSAWQIDEDTYKAHIEPVAQTMADDFTAGYLRPSLKAAGVADWASYCVGYDASALLVAPDRTGDAKDLHDRLVISDEALRDAAGFDDEDAPDEAEHDVRVGILLKNVGLATGGPATEPPAPTPPPPAAPGEQDAGPGNQEKAPPPEPGADEPPDGEASIPGIMELASELIAERAREAAGARLRSRYARDRRVAKLLDGVPNSEVGLILAENLNGELDDVMLERHNLVAGAGECFRPILVNWGIPASAVEMLIAIAESSAAEGLFGVPVPG